MDIHELERLAWATPECQDCSKDIVRANDEESKYRREMANRRAQSSDTGISINPLAPLLAFALFAAAK